MSNNRNRNRSREQRPQGQQVTQGPQDKPFIYNGKNGQIVIPAGTEFDPDAEALELIAQAQQSGDDLAAGGALHRLIKSGFPAEVSATINLKASELKDFTERWMRHSGASIPK
ncbi:hypothetical protein ACTXM3_15340 [Glutamicibacter arilaitensis]|uniref:hypothetical protein n=1 Tax=Glutamicibacter arilaitensis TaxID=256701 RepID=UPI003FD2326C